MPQSGFVLHGVGQSTRALKVELVASFADVELEEATFTMGITNKTPRYLAMNPLGKVLHDLNDVILQMHLTICESSQKLIIWHVFYHPRRDQLHKAWDKYSLICSSSEHL